MEQTYRKRLLVAAWEDFRKFWSAHRYWVTFVSLLLSPLIIQVLRYGLPSLLSTQNILESAALGIGLSIIGNVLIAVWTGAKSLDAGLHEKIQHRDVIVAARDQTIEEQDEKIRSITEPKRTPAEQHHYDTAKKTIERLGPSCVVALRHLKTHGRLIIGTFGSPLPPGIPRDDVIRIYDECFGAGLVTARDNPSQGERMFEIAPTMNAVLDELLYPVTASST
jgi:hypothetical protein